MRTALFLAFLIASGASAHVLRENTSETYLQAQGYEAPYYLPEPQWLHLFSLGHKAALADLIWMKALIYLGEEFEHRGRVDHSFRYADAILDLDPKFRAAYAWASLAGRFRPVAPTDEEVMRSFEYLERGVREFPDDGDLQWQLGAALVYDSPTFFRDDPETMRRLRERGIPHLQRASELGAGPAWGVLSNVTELMQLGRTEQAIRHLQEMYALVEDEDTREQIARQLQNLRADSAAQSLRASEEDLQRRYQRDFPWVPLDFYVLLGDRIVR